MKARENNYNNGIYRKVTGKLRYGDVMTDGIADSSSDFLKSFEIPSGRSRPDMAVVFVTRTGG